MRMIPVFAKQTVFLLLFIVEKPMVQQQFTTITTPFILQTPVTVTMNATPDDNNDSKNDSAHINDYDDHDDKT